MNDNFNTCGEEKYYSDKLWSKDHVFPKVFIYDWKFWQVYLYNFKIIQQTYFLVHYYCVSSYFIKWQISSCKTYSNFLLPKKSFTREEEKK